MIESLRLYINLIELKGLCEQTSIEKKNITEK